MSDRSSEPWLSAIKQQQPAGVGGSSSSSSSEEEEKLREIEVVLNKALGRPYGSLFAEPVDPEELNLPTYFDVIKNPMDLGTCLAKMKDKRYLTAAACAADVRLIWDNAILYNGTDSEVGEIAEGFAKRWEDAYFKIQPDDLPTRLPTLEERQRLSRDIYRVDDGELAIAISAVERGCPVAIEARCAESLVLNIDATDAATFWQAERYVRRCLENDPDKARRNVSGGGDKPRRQR